MFSTMKAKQAQLSSRNRETVDIFIQKLKKTSISCQLYIFFTNAHAHFIAYTFPVKCSFRRQNCDSMRGIIMVVLCKPKKLQHLICKKKSSIRTTLSKS